MSQLFWKPQHDGFPGIDGRKPPAWNEEPAQRAPEPAATLPLLAPSDEPEPDEISLAEPESPASVPLPAGSGLQAVGSRTARKDGREVGSLRVGGTDEYVVECAVYPVSEKRVEPLRPGPYTFPSLREANAFMDETVRPSPPSAAMSRKRRPLGGDLTTSRGDSYLTGTPLFGGCFLVSVAR